MRFKTGLTRKFRLSLVPLALVGALAAGRAAAQPADPARGPADPAQTPADPARGPADPAQAATEAYRACVERYLAAIDSAETGNAPGAVEAAFAAFDSLREALLREGNGPSVLESLSEEEFSQLEDEIPGALINREEVVFVAPDLEYFLELAAERGDEADRAFFAAFQTTYPDGVWPVYVEQQTDYSGCARFGSLSFVETYRTWIDFLKKYPGRYAIAATDEAAAVVEELTETKCACGDAAGVRKELEQFLRAFPDSPARGDVESLLDAVQKGRSEIRENCTSG